MKILIVGGGNMGLTYARSFLSHHVLPDSELLILEKSVEKAKQLRALNLGTVFGEAGDFVRSADLIILAVKPQDTIELFGTLRAHVDHQQVVLSIMAGITIESIAKGLGVPKIIRAMPNLPAQVGSGMTVFTSSEAVTRIELVTVQNLLNATGKTIYVERESAIDAATAISGSGPAYVFFVMQSLIESAIAMGFSQSEAELLTYQTFRGAVELFNKFDLSCTDWIARVSSKGGTTEAAFDVFRTREVATGLKAGIRAAEERAQALSALTD